MAKTYGRNSLDPKNPKMTDRIDYAVRFWGFTAIVAIPVIAMTLVAYLNPFWFRAAGLRGAQRVIRMLTWFRGELVGPIINKYTKIG